MAKKKEEIVEVATPKAPELAIKPMAELFGGDLNTVKDKLNEVIAWINQQ